MHMKNNSHDAERNKEINQVRKSLRSSSKTLDQLDDKSRGIEHPNKSSIAEREPRKISGMSTSIS